jgi:hypothetical protein
VPRGSTFLEFRREPACGIDHAEIGKRRCPFFHSRRCALGALIAAAYQITNDFSRAHDLAISAVRPLYGSATLVNVMMGGVMRLSSHCSTRW